MKTVRARVRRIGVAAWLRGAVLAVAALAVAGCDGFQYPRDPNNTLSRVLASGRMRVVAVEHVPWVTVGEGAPSGAEVALVRAFAETLGAEIEWHRAPAFEALAALGRGEADLAIGGFPREVVNAHSEGAATATYFEDRLIVAAAPGRPIPDSLEGARVYVPSDRLATGLVEEKGGLPVFGPGPEVDLVVLPEWQLAGGDLRATGVVLHRDARVMAVPKGENAWLMRLDRFLRAQTSQVPALLRESVR